MVLHLVTEILLSLGHAEREIRGGISQICRNIFGSPDIDDCWSHGSRNFEAKEGLHNTR